MNRYDTLVSFGCRATSLANKGATAVLQGLIRVYQHTLSRILPALVPGCGCRFHPTCSHYALEAIGTHGPVRGVGLAVWRLLRCHPLHPGGLDPVPPALASRRAPGAPRRRSRPQCARVQVSSPSPHPL